MKTNKGSAAIVILAIIILVLAVAGGLYYKYASNPAAIDYTVLPENNVENTKSNTSETSSTAGTVNLLELSDSLAVHSSKRVRIEVSGLKNTYKPGANISLRVKGIERLDGTEGTPEEGFNVQVYIASLASDGSGTQFAGENAHYNSDTGYWYSTLAAPTDISKRYTVEVSFYCGREKFDCGVGYEDDPSKTPGQITFIKKFTLVP